MVSSFDEPTPLQGAVARAPIVLEGFLRREGLLDVFRPQLPIACPSVFARSGWVSRNLTMGELLRAFDIPPVHPLYLHSIAAILSVTAQVVYLE